MGSGGSVAGNAAADGEDESNLTEQEKAAKYLERKQIHAQAKYLVEQQARDKQKRRIQRRMAKHEAKLSKVLEKHKQKSIEKAIKNGEIKEEEIVKDPKVKEEAPKVLKLHRFNTKERLQRKLAL